MKQSRKFLSILILAALFVLVCSQTAYAFDGRGGDRVVIASGEVVNDDLYVGSQEFVLDGTVNGDVIAFGQLLTVNGTIDGDLMAAGQTVIVNGEVTGAIRMAGSVLFVGEGASVGGDVVAAGYSLEAQPGSTIGQDLVFGGGQILLAGDVARNVQAGTGGFDLRGSVGGNVQAEVGEADQVQGGPPPGMFMPQSPVPVPDVQPGLTIDASAAIEGDLEYTQSNELAIPAGVVAGTVTRNAPASGQAAREETPQQQVTNWALNFVRNSITLVLIGLFLLWLFPVFFNSLSENVRTKPLPSLGWGVVAWMAFFFVVLVLVTVTVLAAILFGVLTLGQLAGTVVFLGLLGLFGLVLSFVLVTTFVAKVIFGAALGRWLLERLHSPLADHRYWPMVIGALITLAVIALLSFPLIPGFLGWLLNVAVVLFGLGALWLWARERTVRRTV